MEGSEAAVMASPLAASHDEFRQIVERHSRGVFRLAYRMTGNEQDAEEVVQETFLRAYRAYDRFEERSQLSTWLHRIATNCALDLLRGRQREQERRLDRRPAGDDDEQKLDPLAIATSGEPGPDRLVLSGEIGRKLRAALARLSAVERTAFVLRHYEGQSIDEISKALNMSVNATKNSVFRAVQKLRAAMEPWMEP